MRWSFRGLLVFLLVASGPAHAAPASARTRGDHGPSNPYLVRGIQLIDDAQDERAIRELKKALSWPGNQRRHLVAIHLHLGIAYFDLLNRNQAAQHFRTAFQLNPRARLSAALSPKIRAFAERLRKRVLPDGRAEGKDAKPSDPDGSEPEPEGSTATEPAPASAQTIEMPPEALPPRKARRPRDLGERQPTGRRHWRMGWPAWTALGVGIAAGGAAIGTGVASGVKYSQSNDTSRPYSEGMELRAASDDLSLATIVLGSVSGAALLTWVLLYYAGQEEAPAGPQTAPEVSLIPGGALISIRGSLW